MHWARMSVGICESMWGAGSCLLELVGGFHPTRGVQNAVCTLEPSGGQRGDWTSGCGDTLPSPRLPLLGVQESQPWLHPSLAWL